MSNTHGCTAHSTVNSNMITQLSPVKVSYRTKKNSGDYVTPWGKTNTGRIYSMRDTLMLPGGGGGGVVGLYSGALGG